MSTTTTMFNDGTYASMPKALMAIPSKHVSPATKLVWMAIVERFGGKDHSWPGAGTIANDTGLSRKGVQKALEQIETLGLLAVLPPDRTRNSKTYKWRT